MSSKAGPGSVKWVVDNTRSIGGIVPEIIGNPRVIDTEKGRALLFNGREDALLLAGNPIEGAAAFTLEALFRPDPGGTFEQRFVHIQGRGVENRVLLEMRATGDRWYGDTYIKSGITHSLLADEKLLHSLGQWHTLAVAFDGVNMIQYLDGRLEVTAPITYQPMGEGDVSLGCRINRIHWFTGAIREVRFTKRALAPAELLKP